MTDKRLIEEAFPLKTASLDSVKEKSTHGGHISSLHIWPARRPLAAARAATIAVLLPDPGNVETRNELTRKIGGELTNEDGELGTNGGLLRWGRENNPDIHFFRDEIRRAFGGKSPRLLDIFAGGGAIPLEAMRLGCDVTAVDYNPVAWFILKCTLEYPAKLADTRWELPTSTGSMADMMPIQGKLAIDGSQGSLGTSLQHTDGDLADHVRYWGQWVLRQAHEKLQGFYPTLPLDPNQPVSDANPLCTSLAYLWARTVPHPDPTRNGVEIPLLKTLWLCKKAGRKRALKLQFSPEHNRFMFEIFEPKSDDEVGAGTMSRNGVVCPPLDLKDSGAFLRSEYLQRCSREGKMGLVCTTVVIDPPRRKIDGKTTSGKEFRVPTQTEIEAIERSHHASKEVFQKLPFGIPSEPVPQGASRTSGGSAFTVFLYGLDKWHKLFTPRQLLMLGTFAELIIRARDEMERVYEDDTAKREILLEALQAYLAVALNRAADMNSMICSWNVNAQTPRFTFTRYALPMTWDFYEAGWSKNGFASNIAEQDDILKTTIRGLAGSQGTVTVVNVSATDPHGTEEFDIVMTDPPYYDAIPYADLSDFFYVWLKRSVGQLYAPKFDGLTTPKIGELVQQSDRHQGNQESAKRAYEDGMASAFRSAWQALKSNGRMVIVFAHKQPDAWETLVASMVKAGFVVTASWPIDTERAGRVRANNSAALSSSVWLICRKRPANAGKGWYKQVQPRMRERITERLRYFWDEGVRGPDFLWAAIGPGLEAFSAYDEVRRNDGSTFTISEFIKEVRRLTTDFALGQILHGGTEGLDDWTRYALMHAQNFGTGGAPVGEAILLAGAYGLDLNVLTGPKGILTKGKGKAAKISEDGDETSDEEAAGSGGTDLRLLYWEERKRDDLGEPLESGDWHVIDAIHRLMREWASGDVTRAAIYADRLGLGNNDLFWRVAQAFVEMGALQSKERSMLEAIISWGRGRTPQFTYASNGTTVNVAPQRPSTLSMDFDQE